VKEHSKKRKLNNSIGDSPVEGTKMCDKVQCDTPEKPRNSDILYDCAIAATPELVPKHVSETHSISEDELDTVSPGIEIVCKSIDISSSDFAHSYEALTWVQDELHVECEQEKDYVPDPNEYITDPKEYVPEPKEYVSEPENMQDYNAFTSSHPLPASTQVLPELLDIKIDQFASNNQNKNNISNLKAGPSCPCCDAIMTPQHECCIIDTSTSLNNPKEKPPDDDPDDRKALAEHLQKPETRREIKELLNEQCKTQ
jgi:hypothetical protein